MTPFKHWFVDSVDHIRFISCVWTQASRPPFEHRFISFPFMMSVPLFRLHLHYILKQRPDDFDVLFAQYIQHLSDPREPPVCKNVRNVHVNINVNTAGGCADANGPSVFTDGTKPSTC